MKSQLQKHCWFSRMVFALSLGVPFLSTGCGNPATSKTSPVSVAIVPSKATVPKDGSLSFVATVIGAADTKVAWSVQEGKAGGTITSKGVYTAPSTFGTYHVVATSDADATTSASAEVKIGEPPGTFTAVDNMTTARAAHSATLLRNGKVLIAGGTDGIQPLASAELYDPSTRTFSPTGSMITPRYSHSATLLADGRVLIAGGTQDANHGIPVFTAELYDPSTGVFTATGDLSSIGGDLSAPWGNMPVSALLPDGRVFVAAPDNAETYDPQSGTFTLTGPYADSAPTFDLTVTLLTKGQVLITGCANQCSVQVNELFDPKSGTFGVTGPMPGNSWSADGNSATLLTDGRVLFVSSDGFLDTADAEVYDPAAGTFASIGSAIESHVGAPAVRLTDGTVLIAGGTRGSWTGSTDAELYVPAIATFQFASQMTVRRYGQTATLLPDGTVLFTGGHIDSPDPTATAEIYKPGAQ